MVRVIAEARGEEAGCKPLGCHDEYVSKELSSCN